MSIVKYLFPATLIIPVFAGCATFWPSKSVTDEAPEKAEEKRAEMVGSFDAKRDVAQFDAAKVRWREGDTSGCKELVGKLLLRNPKHRGGRLLKAELQLEDGKPDLAIADVETLVKEDPKDAEASHMLGLLLEAVERPQEALPHFERAAQIAPENQVFATSYQSALVGEPSLDIEGAVATDTSESGDRRMPMMKNHSGLASQPKNQSSFASQSTVRKTRDIRRPTR